MRQFGRCFRVDLARSSEGKSRGYAFVEFENAESAAIAAEYLDGSELDGRFLRAEISNFPPDDLIEMYFYFLTPDIEKHQTSGKIKIAKY